MRVNTTFKNSSRGTCKFMCLVFVRVLSESYLPTLSAPTIRCLYNAVSLTLVREKCFIIIIVYLFIRPSISMYLNIYVFICLSLCLCSYISIYIRSTNLPVYLYYIPICLSLRLFVSVCLSASFCCLSICLYVRLSV